MNALNVKQTFLLIKETKHIYHPNDYGPSVVDFCKNGCNVPVANGDKSFQYRTRSFFFLVCIWF